jgi:hypothetical protein
VPRRLPLRKRIATATRWPVGVTLTSWRYMWRTTPMTRTEQAGDWHADGPPPLPPGVSTEEVQRPGDGAGPLFHRRYAIHLRDTDASPEDVIARVSGDPNVVSPTEFAQFIKVRGDESAMRPGDEYTVRMAGPWDGPVRVVDKQPASFRLVTLEGHLEAGQIEFRAARQDGPLTFEIESWARSADRLVHLLYDRLRMAKETQLHMWISMLERVEDITSGRRQGRLEVHTRRAEPPPG